MQAPIVLPPKPFEGRPKHSPSELRDDVSRAAASLESGVFQYVSTSVFSQITQYLTNVAATAIDPASSQIYMLRRVEPALVILNPDGSLSSTRSDTNIIQGHSIKVFSGINGGPSSLWVTDMAASCIRIFDTTGNTLSTLGPDIEGTSSVSSTDDLVDVPGLHGPVTLGKVTDVAFDPAQGQVYVADGDVGGPNNRVLVLNSSHQCVAVWGSPGLQGGPSTSQAQFNLPHAVLVDAISRVWVVDSLNSRVQVFDSAGNFLAQISVPGQKLYGIALSTARQTSAEAATLYITGSSISDPDQGTVSLYQVAVNGANPSNIIRDVALNPNNQPLTTWDLTAGMLHSVTVGGSADRELLLLSTLPSTSLTAPSALAYEMATPRPQLKIQSVYQPPVWPSKFVATILLHPFRIGDPIWVAKVAYDESLRGMIFNLVDLSGNSVVMVFKTTATGNQLWLRPGGQTYGPYTTPLTVPKADWLVPSTICAGVLPILGVDCNWWSERISSVATNWHWFRSDTNVPWRTMNSAEGNSDKVPIIGDFAFIYWPYFDVVAENDVAETLTQLDQQSMKHNDLHVATIMNSRATLLTKANTLMSQAGLDHQETTDLSTLIPGLSPGNGGLPLPVWPQQFFMTCTMTPVNNPTPLSTEMTYNWPAESQRTRMFDPPKQGAPQTVTDAELIGSKTWIFSRSANGDFKCGTELDFGPTSPTWATTGGGKIMYTITNNPKLSPGTVTRCFCAPIDEPGQFWIWYKAGDIPVVFCQTRPPAQEGTNLALADYSSFQVTDLIDPDTFDVPPPCEQAKDKSR